MSRKLRIAFVPLAWVVAVAPSRAADLGTAFTYQGYLEKPPGTPLTDTCNFVFRLYDDPAGGMEQGNSPQSLNGVAVIGGVFAVNPDFGPTALDGAARWLRIEVQCTGDMSFAPLSPRVELKPAPHAMRAVEAAALDLPYAPTMSLSAPMLELTQTGDGPAAIFKVQPQPEPPLPQPAIEAISGTAAPALKATNDATGPAAIFDVGPNHLAGLPAVQITNSGLGSAAVLEKAGAVPDYFHPTLEVRADTGGPAARVWVQPQPEPPLPVAALEVLNETDGPAATFGIDPRFTPAAAIMATNSGLGSAATLEKVGAVDYFHPTLKATNVSRGPGLEVTNGELSVSGAPTLRATNLGIGTAAYLSAANGAALHAVSAAGLAAYLEGGVSITAGLDCASLAWAASGLSADQGGAIELGNSLTTGNSPYIDFHRGVGLAEDYNVRLQNDADGQLKVVGNLAATGGLTVSGDLSVEAGLTVSGELSVDAGLTVTGDLTVESEIKKAYTVGTSNRAAPLAYATVDGATGLVLAGTPNVSSSWDSTNQRYLITVAGETYATNTHVTTVTPVVGGAPEALFATTASGSGQLRIRIMSSSTGTTGLQKSFSFIVYKP
jgi:hypothetical protein